MVHIHRTKSGQFRVRIKSRNGKLLHFSEEIKTRQAVDKNIAALKKAVEEGVKDHTR